MGKRLIDNLTSDYVGAAGRMRPKGARMRVVAYVEGFDDVFFWRNVLGRFEDDTLAFQVMLPSRDSLAKGKKVAIASMLAGKLGENMIACVDADYDYLMQGATEGSRTVCGNPYVFHTFAYAIENFQCYAPSLRNVCVMATLNDRDAFDFEGFAAAFSRTVYPLFVWSIWCYRSGHHREFSMADLCGVFATREVNLLHPSRAIDVLRRKVNRAVSALQRRFPQAKGEYSKLRDELRALGVTPDSTYMYIRGHDIFDNLVSPLVARVCEVLRREREREIQRLAANSQQLQNELAGYRHSTASAELTLRKQTGFYDAPQYRQILGQVGRFVDALKRRRAAAEGGENKGKKAETAP